MFKRLSSRSRAILAGLVAATVSTAAALGQSSVRRAVWNLLSPDKKVSVVVTFLDPTGDEVVDVETELGEEMITPMLQAKGYEVEHVIPFHGIVASAGNPRNPPIRQFFNERDPSRDEARLLFVTFVTLPNHKGSLQTGLAFLDVKASGLEASKTGTPRIDIRWTYSDSVNLGNEGQNIDKIESKAKEAINQYDRQRKGGDR